MANELSRDKFVGVGKPLPLHRERVVIPEARETAFWKNQGKYNKDKQKSSHFRPAIKRGNGLANQRKSNR
jgi:hypothetical protein